MAVHRSYPHKQHEMNLQTELNLKPMKTTYKTPHQAKQESDPGTETVRPSMTIPGEVDDIKTVLQKHKNGQPVREKPVHYIDAELDQIDRYHRKDLDLTDLEKLSKHNKRIGDKIREIKDAEEQEKKQKELDEKIEAEIKKRQEQSDKSKSKPED